MSARTIIEAAFRTYWLGYIDNYGAVQLRRAKSEQQNHDDVFMYAGHRKFRYTERNEPWPYGFDVFAVDWDPDVQEKDAIHQALIRAGVKFGVSESEVDMPALKKAAEAVRRELRLGSRDKGFCLEASRLLQKKLSRLGIEARVAEGKFVTPHQKFDHYWVAVGDVIVDPTADQFHLGPQQEPVVVAPSSQLPHYVEQELFPRSAGVLEAEVKPARRWLVTIPTSGTTPWRKVVATATSEEAAWYQAYGEPARNFRLSRSKYGDTRVVVLKKRPSNGIVGYIDPILPEA